MIHDDVGVVDTAAAAAQRPRISNLLRHFPLVCTTRSQHYYIYLTAMVTVIMMMRPQNNGHQRRTGAPTPEYLSAFAAADARMPAKCVRTKK